MTLTLPVLAVVLSAVFLCPAITLYFVMKWWRESLLRHRDERKELMDRLFARNWEQWKAFEVADMETPKPMTEAEEYEDWMRRANEASPGIDKVGTIVE